MNKKNTDIDFGDYPEWLDDKDSVALTSYVPSEGVDMALKHLYQNVRETLRVPNSEWEGGKTVVFSLEFQVVPKAIKVRVEKAE